MSIPFPDVLNRERDTIRQRLGVSWQHYQADLDLLLHLRWLGVKPSCIYDIGASNTVWSVMAHAVFPTTRLELFEPLADISKAYRDGKLTHPAIRDFLEHADFRIHPIALGTRNGTCEFQHFDNDSASTSLALEHRTSSAHMVSVPMRRLDDYVQEKSIPPPELIKLDTQGSEMGILEGGMESLKKAHVVFIECWLTKGYGRNTPLFLPMANLLSENGFDLFAIGDEYRGDDGVAQTKDAVFVKRDVVLSSILS